MISTEALQGRPPVLSKDTVLQIPLPAVVSVAGGGGIGFYLLYNRLDNRLDSLSKRLDTIDSTLKTIMLIGQERDKYVLRNEAEAFFAGKQHKEIGEGGSEEQASAGTA
ncbi:uncharacterized protein JCM10292_003385 [Rhodotorula paludigena]|uniref:uncharacterized protein n=1 Tax=Rhodotorula paludigena TaxID=86838 RepID=UPI00317D53FA